MPLIKCPDCGGEVSTSAQACPHCGCPRTTGTHPVVTQHRGGKYEAAGFVLIVLGVGLFFAGMPRLGGLMFVGGFVVFLIGRFL